METKPRCSKAIDEKLQKSKRLWEIIERVKKAAKGKDSEIETGNRSDVQSGKGSSSRYGHTTCSLLLGDRTGDISASEQLHFGLRSYDSRMQ